MAGFYPDPPGNRIVYHLNGSAAVRINSVGDVSTVTGQRFDNAANEDNADYGDFLPPGNNGKFAIIFPEPFNLTHYYLWATGVNAVGPIEVSEDTTNGVDGTWTQVAATWVNGASISPDYRTDAVALVGAVDARGIRFLGDADGFFGAAARVIHLYGVPSAIASLDRLELWHPTLNQSLFATPAFFDWGDIARNTNPAPTKQFRIKNCSTTFTANGIQVAADMSIDTGSARPFSDAHSFSLDGTTFTPTVTISSLGTTTISGIITVKYSPTLTDPLSLNAGFIKTTTASWS